MKDETANQPSHFKKALYVPRYVPVPATLIFSKDITHGLRSQYTKLRALAYAHGFQHTDPITYEYLAEVLSLELRTLHHHLRNMRIHELISIENVSKGKVIIRFFDVAAEVDLYLQPDGTLTETPDLIAQAISAIPKSTRSKLTDDQAYIYAQLTGRGVYPAPALHIAKLQDATPASIMIRCEYYDFAAAVGIAKEPAYLRRSAEEGWNEPAGYVVPADQCESCYGSIWFSEHKRSCKQSYAHLFNDIEHSSKAFTPFEDCPTCGNSLSAEHEPDCWRKRFKSEIELPLKYMAADKQRYDYSDWED